MSTAIKIGSLVCIAASFCFAETFTGRLVDSACMNQQAQSESRHQKENACQPNTATTEFGIVTSSGEMLQLDANGNAQAQTDVKNATPNQPIMATISGSKSGNVVTVESIKTRQ